MLVDGSTQGRQCIRYGNAGHGAGSVVCVSNRHQVTMYSASKVNRGTGMNIDHFMYAGPDLDVLSQGFAALTGVEAEPGGQHPQIGTHNRLIGSKGPMYLELIAPDPTSAARSPLRAGIAQLPRPCLHRFIMDATGADLDHLVSVYAKVGISSQVQDMHRITPAGTTLRWRLLVPDDNRYGLFAPFFIDWLHTPHPSTRLAQGFETLEIEAGHPSSEALRALWQDLGVPIDLHLADAAYLRLGLKTPRGRVDLTSM